MTKLITVLCANCGVSVERRAAQVKLAKNSYCSYACKHIGHRKRVELTCETCGSSFVRRPSELPESGKLPRFCSRACSAGSAMVGFTCVVCGLDFRVYRSSEKARSDRHCCSWACYVSDPSRRTNKGFKWSDESRAKLSRAASRPKPWLRKPPVLKTCEQCGEIYAARPGKEGLEDQRFCAATCWYEWVVENPSIRPGAGRSSPYANRAWQRIRDRVLVRDGHMCQRCKCTPPARLNVHHIIPLKCFGYDDLAQAHAADNLVTLCCSCHRKTESLVA